METLAQPITDSFLDSVRAMRPSQFIRSVRTDIDRAISNGLEIDMRAYFCVDRDRCMVCVAGAYILRFYSQHDYAGLVKRNYGFLTYIIREVVGAENTVAAWKIMGLFNEIRQGETDAVAEDISEIWGLDFRTLRLIIKAWQGDSFNGSMQHNDLYKLHRSISSLATILENAGY